MKNIFGKCFSYFSIYSSVCKNILSDKNHNGKSVNSVNGQCGQGARLES